MRIRTRTLAATLAPALLLTPAAHAQQEVDIEIHGSLQAAWTHFDAGDQSRGETLDDGKEQSRIGIGARRPVADDLGVLGNVELGLNPAGFQDENDRADLHAREAWVGVLGGFGQLRAGRLPGAYKQVGGINWDPMNATELQQRGAGGLSGGVYGHDGWLSHLIEYRTTSMGGLELIAQYGLDDRDDRSGGDTLIGAIYEEEGWELIGAYSRDDSAESGANRNWKAGFHYTTGEASLGYQYERARIADTITEGSVLRDDSNLELAPADLAMDRTHHLVVATQRYDQFLLSLTWGYLDADDDAFDLYNYTAALNYFLTRHFRWYGGIQYQDRSEGYASGALTVGSTGVRFDF